jgi:hypothetical protein
MIPRRRLRGEGLGFLNLGWGAASPLSISARLLPQDFSVTLLPRMSCRITFQGADAARNASRVLRSERSERRRHRLLHGVVLFAPTPSTPVLLRQTGTRVDWHRDELTTLEVCCAPKLLSERIARDPHVRRANSKSLLGASINLVPTRTARYNL